MDEKFTKFKNQHKQLINMMESFKTTSMGNENRVVCGEIRAPLNPESDAFLFWQVNNGTTFSTTSISKHCSNTNIITEILAGKIFPKTYPVQHPTSLFS